MTSVIGDTSAQKHGLKRYLLLEELRSWHRSLEFYKQETAFLKCRLSEIVDQTEGINFIKTAEHYQNKFLQTDVALEKIQQKIQSFKTELKATDKEVHKVYTLQQKQDKFRRLFLKFEQGYLVLCKEFSEKVLDSIS